MRKEILAYAMAAMTAFVSSAQSEMLTIILNDGSSQQIAVTDIREMLFEDADINEAERYAGVYEGTLAMTVGGAYTYETPASVTLTAKGDEIMLSYPEFSLQNTMMGDITLAELSIPGLSYYVGKGGFYRSYGGQGLTQHFKAEKEGQTTMDSDYPLNDPSTVLVTLSSDGTLTIENPFKLGAMPLPLSLKFSGTQH